MINKYDQLKKNMKHFSEIYSPGILVSTLDSARIAITDLQAEIESLKAITELAVKGLEIISLYPHYPDDNYSHSLQAVQREATITLTGIEGLSNAQT